MAQINLPVLTMLVAKKATWPVLTQIKAHSIFTIFHTLVLTLFQCNIIIILFRIKFNLPIYIFAQIIHKVQLHMQLVTFFLLHFLKLNRIFKILYKWMLVRQWLIHQHTVYTTNTHKHILNIIHYLLILLFILGMELLILNIQTDLLHKHAKSTKMWRIPLPYTVDTFLHPILPFKYMLALRFNTIPILLVNLVPRYYAIKMVKFHAQVDLQVNVFIALNIRIFRTNKIATTWLLRYVLMVIIALRAHIVPQTASVLAVIVVGFNIITIIIAHQIFIAIQNLPQMEL